MTKMIRILLVAALALSGAFLGAGVANADIDNAAANNLQEGDNETSGEQSGSSASGDAVGGQVTGIVSAGDASVDATNTSEDVDVETGDATAANAAATFTGQNVAGGGTTIVATDITNAAANNLLEGDNTTDYAQSAEAASGDGVGGQVIGAVTSAGGSADIVAENVSEDVDIETGDATARNAFAAFVGQDPTGNFTLLAGIATGTALGTPTPTATVPSIPAIPSDITNAAANNIQEGDNDLSASQDATAASGDGVGGQVLGVVSAGDASIDASNVSEDVDLESGEVTARNAAATFVGQLVSANTTLVAADINAAAANNLQEGDNERSLSQAADAASGDAVGGQVAGVVTSAGGSADAVLDNTSEDVDGETGESDFVNADAGFVGQNATNGNLVLLTPGAGANP